MWKIYEINYDRITIIFSHTIKKCLLIMDLNLKKLYNRVYSILSHMHNLWKKTRLQLILFKIKRFFIKSSNQAIKDIRRNSLYEEKGRKLVFTFGKGYYIGDHYICKQCGEIKWVNEGSEWTFTHQFIYYFMFKMHICLVKIIFRKN